MSQARGNTTLFSSSSAGLRADSNIEQTSLHLGFRLNQHNTQIYYRKGGCEDVKNGTKEVFCSLLSLYVEWKRARKKSVSSAWNFHVVGCRIAVFR